MPGDGIPRSGRKVCDLRGGVCKRNIRMQEVAVRLLPEIMLKVQPVEKIKSNPVTRCEAHLT